MKRRHSQHFLEKMEQYTSGLFYALPFPIVFSFMGMTITIHLNLASSRYFVCALAIFVMLFILNILILVWAQDTFKALYPEKD